MKYPRVASRVGAALFMMAMTVSLLPASGFAAGTAPDLVLREAKVTGDEFIVLQAQADIPDLSMYWLGYTSNDSTANVVPSQQLPSVSLLADQVILLNNGSAATCDASYVTKLAFSPADTKGLIELRRLDTDVAKGTSTFTTVDHVNWQKPSSSGTTSDNLDIRHEDGLTNPVWYKDSSTANPSWQVGDFTGCSLTLASAVVGTPPQTVIWPQDDTSPPSIIVAASSQAATMGPFIPASDIGLKPPQLSEILPNPASPETDATDEYIELYNPNDSIFDLSGFQLRIGSTTSVATHTYTFPAGVSLPGKSFKAFMSAETHLSLNNSGGQVWLLDPLDALIGQSDVYDTAKDGQAWVNAAGKWQWTLQASPDKTNTVTTPIAASSTKSATVKGTTLTAVRGVSTSAKGSTAPADSSSAPVATVTPVHSWVLAAVIAAALLYGAYEYRVDLQNHLYQFRRHRAARRTAGH